MKFCSVKRLVLILPYISFAAIWYSTSYVSNEDPMIPILVPNLEAVVLDSHPGVPIFVDSSIDSKPFVSANVQKRLTALISEINLEERDFSSFYENRGNSRTGMKENYSLKGWAQIPAENFHQPATTVECILNSKTEFSLQTPFCVYNNMYYDAVSDTYYSLRSQNSTAIDVPFFTELDKVQSVQNLPRRINFSITKPALLAQPPHPNYCHGFLEELHCNFWAGSVLQGRRFGLNPTQIVYWIARSWLFDEYPDNWDKFFHHEGENSQFKYHFSDVMHPALSIYPLGFNAQPNLKGSLIHFSKLFVPGRCAARSVFVNRHGFEHPTRRFPNEPFSDRVLGRWMLLFGDYLLRRFNIQSKFIASESSGMKELVVISPRKGAGRREILNSAGLITSLSQRFINVSELSVVDFEFSSMHDTMKNIRRTRLLITPHGAGMSNLIFMRPGASVLETDSFLCSYHGDWYGKLAKVINVNHRVWTEKSAGDSRTSCSFDASITLDIDQVSDIAEELILEESLYRDAHYADAISKISDIQNME
jgi:hypothetical protein